jgi:hydroxymethylpyrimidine pyrophosphatase-like HAD family hydrolase
LEILPGGITKGSGLTKALKFRGLEGQNVIAFGDEENDLSMFSVAGFSAAPSNARDTVYAAADFKLCSNNDDGVAEFLEKLFGF